MCVCVCVCVCVAWPGGEEGEILCKNSLGSEKRKDIFLAQEWVPLQVIAQTMIILSPESQVAERETGGWFGVLPLESPFWKSQTSPHLLSLPHRSEFPQKYYWWFFQTVPGESPLAACVSGPGSECWALGSACHRQPSHSAWCSWL